MGKLKDLSSFIGTEELTSGLDLWKAVLAEFLGTTLLVFVGCGSCISDGFGGDFPEPTTTQIALCFGITVATLAQAIGHVSGCHINPAVTLGMLSARYTPLVRGILYIIVQCVGAITGSALLMAVTPENIHENLGLTKVNGVINVGQAFGVEVLITFVLVFTVFGVCDERRTDVKGSAPLAIGLSITACHLFAVPLTGSSMNPARSFGPAVVLNFWDNHWVYWTGPSAGGVLAGLVYRMMTMEKQAPITDHPSVQFQPMNEQEESVDKPDQPIQENSL